MDDNTGWSLLFGLAVLVSGCLAGWGSTMTSQQSLARGWMMLVSCVPLLSWFFSWNILGNSTNRWRHGIAIGLGLTVGPVLLYGLSEVLLGSRSLQTENSVAATTAPAPLIRSFGFDKLKATIAQSSNGAVVFEGYSGYLSNFGPDLLAVSIKHYDITVGTTKLMISGGQTEDFNTRYIPPTQFALCGASISPAIPLRVGTTPIILSITIEYDTVPKTGVRRSSRDVEFDVTVQADMSWSMTNRVLKQTEY